MKLLSSNILILAALVATADARKTSSSLSLAASSTRSRTQLKKKAAFVNNNKSSASFLVNDAAKEVRGGESGGSSATASWMFNLIKATVGVGVLSLPAGKSCCVLFFDVKRCTCSCNNTSYIEMDDTVAVGVLINTRRALP